MDPFLAAQAEAPFDPAAMSILADALEESGGLVGAGVLRGGVKGEDLIPRDLQAWCELRGGLERRRAILAQGRRFRRDPAAYLQKLENTLIKETLPPQVFFGAPAAC